MSQDVLYRKKGNSRDETIDILRFLAITGIIIAHVKPSLLWLQLRNFDVPLMVFLSGVCFYMSKNKKVSYIPYLRKRFIRLILPTWIFLCFYFTTLYLNDNSLDITKIIMCYTLTTPWYFWIVRILVGLAIIAPVLVYISNRLSIEKLVICCLLLFVLTEVLSSLSASYLYKIIIMFIPYISVFLLGMNVERIKENIVLDFGALFLFLYLFTAYYLYIQTGVYISIQGFKYPPRIYYIEYALSVTAILWSQRDKIAFLLKKNGLFKFAKFVGSHTFWIYLWHIPMVDCLHVCNNGLLFFFVFFLAILITYLQVLIVDVICNYIINQSIKQNVRMIFIG